MMDIRKKQELLDSLKSEFDDYLDYYDLMECLPDITDAKIEALKNYRTRNGLSKFSYFTQHGKGTLMVSFSKFRLWYKNNFKPLAQDEIDQVPEVQA